MEDGFDLDFDFSLTAAKYAWRLGTWIGSELRKLADGEEGEGRGSHEDSTSVMRHIDYGHLPDRYFDYGKF